MPDVTSSSSNTLSEGLTERCRGRSVQEISSRINSLPLNLALHSFPCIALHCITSGSQKGEEVASIYMCYSMYAVGLPS